MPSDIARLSLNTTWNAACNKHVQLKSRINWHRATNTLDSQEHLRSERAVLRTFQKFRKIELHLACASWLREEWRIEERVYCTWTHHGESKVLLQGAFHMYNGEPTTFSRDICIMIRRHSFPHLWCIAELRIFRCTIKKMTPSGGRASKSPSSWFTTFFDTRNHMCLYLILHHGDRSRLRQTVAPNTNRRVCIAPAEIRIEIVQTPQSMCFDT